MIPLRFPDGPAQGWDTTLQAGDSELPHLKNGEFMVK